MQTATRKALYALLAILMILDFYSIFNAGNPDSLLRFIVRDPSYDITVTVGISLIIAVISLSMTQDNRKNSLKGILKSNHEYIMQLKETGQTDEEIADSFIAALKLEKKFSQGMVRNRVLRYLRKL